MLNKKIDISCFSQMVFICCDLLFMVDKFGFELSQYKKSNFWKIAECY